MRIAYIAKHGNGQNDDEGSILHALQQLGHDVLPIQECSNYSEANSCDFVLFHHHRRSPHLLERVKAPKVFWFFDVIDHPLLPQRQGGYPAYFRSISTVGFCTDGEYASKFSNVYHLMQGADSRVVGPAAGPEVFPVVFAGGIRFPRSRAMQLEQLQSHYGRRLKAYVRNYEWVYRRDFAALVAKSSVMISLKDPSKDNYWSNRVYVVSGFGGVIVHPYCQELAKQYTEGEEITFYRGNEDLITQVDNLLVDPIKRKRLRENALKRTLQEHTYWHRCERLVNIVKDYL